MAEQENVIDARDVTASIGFLTRLPVRVDGDWAVARGARSAWAYPVAGLVVGGLVCHRRRHAERAQKDRGKA
ncbi:MAG: adenosylcobinamide-GDP ribazoletransferase, partial [Pseudomonadota bacterium]